MPREPFHVAFYDSSDDEQNEHMAEIVPVVDGVSPQTTPSTRDENGHPEEEQREQGQRRQERKSSWLGRIANGTTAFLSYAFGGGNEVNADDSHEAGSAGYGSRDNDQWGYSAHRDVARRSVELQDGESFAPSEEIAIDLRETILQYKRTPDDVYMRIILAALNFGEVQVGGDLFRAAYGSRDLMKVLMESGKVNYDDPGVQEIIQKEIDSIIVPDASCGGRISPDKIGYLALLCHAPSATLTKGQARLFRHAGFEFVKMLYENPHLLRNQPPPRWIVARILDVCYFLDMIVTWLGLIAALINFACVGWITRFWLSKGPRIAAIGRFYAMFLAML
ncbi:hypothetical protein LSM04_009582 [Trypanosoma melophagium]|uniref:uncharacterized protein n=1 Tax=Trypanosoma melophagium TaxID=715481 RepID=UPI003519D8A1|nr:hypothetical protein LSM04_009582 [Trypanosoma melophagium]